MLHEEGQCFDKLSKNGICFSFYLLVTALGGCAEKWPEDGRAWLEERLAKGPNGFDCYHSSWNREVAIPFPSPSVLDGKECSPATSETLWSATDDAVNAVARCRAAGHTFEFSVTAFSVEHHYDGYYCNYAAAPFGTALPPLGDMTNRGTAMDGDFKPYSETVSGN